MGSVDPRFRVLGPVEVVTADGSPASPPGRKPRALLAVLLLRRGAPVSHARLADDLWAGSPSEGAEATVRSHVSGLRRWLASLGMPDAIATGPGGYRWAAEGGLDADVFERLVGSSQEALGLDRPERAVARATEALGTWRGTPFPELADVVDASTEAARLAELRCVALEVRVDARLRLGQHREVVPELETLVAAHPFRERFWGQLVVALYRCGRQADAVAAYARVREALADELGLDPGPELQQLAQRILRQDPLLLADAVAGTDAVEAPAPTVARLAMPDAVLDAAARVPMVGRTDEHARAVSAWEAVVRREGRVVLVSGEAGIGKTRLVAEIAARAARDGGAVLVGRCEEAAHAFHAVADALGSHDDVGRVVADLPDVARTAVARMSGRTAPTDDGPLDQRATAYAATVQVLRRLAEPGPVLLVVEDAERIDRASALLLRHVVGRLPAGVMLVVCFRDPPGARHEPLADLLGDVAGNDLVERVALGTLDEAATLDLLGAVAPDVGATAGRRVWERTGGHPYFVVEVGRAIAAGPVGADDVPPALRDALRQRLVDLDPTARDVLAAAAVLGGQADFGLIAAVLEIDDDTAAQSLDRAVDAGVLVESGRTWAGAYSFPHDLVRDAIRADLPAHRVRRLHARAAQALAGESAPGGPRSPAVAWHLREAGAAAAAADTVAWASAAARECATLGAWDEAIEHAEVAVEVLRAGDERGALAQACVAAADLRLRSTRGFDRAVDLLDLALREHVAAGDLAAASAVHARLGSALCLHHSVMDVPRALDHLDAARRLRPSWRGASVLLGLTQAAMFGLRTTLLQESAEGLAEAAAATGRVATTALADWAAGWAAFNRGEPAEALDRLDRSWATAHALADPSSGWGSVNAAALIANGYLLDPGLARSWCRRALGQPRFDGLAYGHVTVVDQLVHALAAQGDLAAARDAAADLPVTSTARRTLLLLDGRWEEAEAAWREASTADLAVGDLHDAATNLRWLASARELLGDVGGARAALEQALDLAVAGPQAPTEVAARAELARLLASTDPSVARGHLAAIDAGEHDTSWHGLGGRVELARALVTAAEGGPEAATAHHEAALATFRRHGLVWHVAETHRARAGVLGSHGDGDGARLERGAALEVLTAIGAADRWRGLVGDGSR